VDALFCRAAHALIGSLCLKLYYIPTGYENITLARSLLSKEGAALMWPFCVVRGGIMKLSLKPSASFIHLCKQPAAIGAGFVLLTIVVSIALSARSLLPLFSLEGLLIVAGGVIAVAFMSFQKEDVHHALKAIKAMFRHESHGQDNLAYDMMKIVAWASVIKERGMRSLESTVKKSGIVDPFITYGLNMVVSEYTPDEVRAMMETAANACYQRDSAPVDVLHAMASHAPAFGMVGTLVGMVAMLCNLGDSMASVGPSLAVSFLSTLYGVISARMFYLPAAARLQHEIDSRRFRYHLITEGMVMLVGNKSPMYIQDRLNSFLRPETRNYFDYFNVTANRVDSTKQSATRHLKAVQA
jgi:chemotaxis protein MotA